MNMISGIGRWLRDCGRGFAWRTDATRAVSHSGLRDAPIANVGGLARAV
jgi:hypothetical protein